MTRKWLFFTITYLLGSFLVLLFSFLHNDMQTIKEVSYYWGTIIVLQFAAFLALLYSRHKTLNNPYLYFILAAFICWFGQVVVILFNLKTETSLVIESFNPAQFYTTLQYGSICFFALCVVGLLFTHKGNYGNFTTSFTNRLLQKSINLVGILMVLISSYNFFSKKITNLATSLSYGYGEIYNSQGGVAPITESTENIISSLSMFFIPGIMLLLVANKNNTIVRRLLVSILLFSIAISFLAGGRGEALAIIIGLFWIYSNEIKKMNVKSFIVSLILGLIIIQLVTVTAQFRVIPDRTFSSFVELFFSNDTNLIGSLANMLGEFGFNIFSLHHTMALIPAVQDYSFGYTYLAAALAIIPSYFFNGYSFSAAAALPDWLKNILHMDFGPGYSIVAESFYNFGWFGILALIALGIILTRALANKQKDKDFKTLRNGFIAIFIYSNLFIARDTSLFVFRKYFYTIIIPLLLITIMYSIYRRRKKEIS